MSIWPLLYSRYPAGEYAIMQEVSDAAGFGRSRSADGIVMNLWPSRGLELSGIECKSSRSDWLRELKKPEKAENIFKYCDRWWLVTDNEEIAKIEEIPPTWGWMSGNKNGTRIIVKKEAPQLKPEQCSREFLAAMMKRISQGMVHKSTLEDEIERRAVERTNIKRDNHKYELENRERDIKELRETIANFEKESGIKLDRWDMGNIGKSIKLLREVGIEYIENRMVRMRDEAKNICDQLEKGIETFRTKNGTEQNS